MSYEKLEDWAFNRTAPCNPQMMQAGNNMAPFQTWGCYGPIMLHYSPQKQRPYLYLLHYQPELSHLAISSFNFDHVNACMLRAVES